MAHSSNSEPPARRPVIVTGGAGFIGSHLVEALLAQGEEVVVIDDLSTGKRENLNSIGPGASLRIIEARVSEVAELDDLVATTGFVFHLAAAVGVELVLDAPVRSIRTNLTETEAILSACAKARVPVLLASSSEVYGRSAKEAFSEEDDLLIGPPNFQRWGYACSKLMDEFLAFAYAAERGLPVIVARLFNTVGPRQTGRYGMVFPRFVEAALRGDSVRVYGDGRQTRCFCYVLDTVEALIRLRRSPGAIGRVVNVGRAREISIARLARTIVKSLGSTSELEFVPYEEAYGPGFEDFRRRKPDLSRLQEYADYLPQTPLERIIRQTAAFMASSIARR